MGWLTKLIPVAKLGDTELLKTEAVDENGSKREPLFEIFKKDRCLENCGYDENRARQQFTHYTKLNG